MTSVRSNNSADVTGKIGAPNVGEEIAVNGIGRNKQKMIFFYFNEKVDGK